MRAMLCSFLVLFLHMILSLVGVSSRHFDPQDGFAFNNQGTVQNPRSLQITQSLNEGIKKRMELVEEPGANKEINKIGSSPPSCEHKCYGCMPCEAIQVPTTTSLVGVQYTNYEPEGWKCKCGPAFYSP
ncbi:hypothetical protein Pfo_019921 [Paulownia fortunei]|nr:hypothetical protein Pfo_019921 [Paulownia fortunei]